MRPATTEAFAALLEHIVLRPDLTELEAAKESELAKSARAAAVIVRPCDIDVAVRILSGGATAPASVAGYPYGDQNTGTKLYELRDLLRRGAKEAAFTLNVSKLRSRQFQYVETEILQAVEACRKDNARLTVLFPNEYLTDEHRIVACRIVARCEAVSAASSRPVPSELQVMRAHLPEDIGLTAYNVTTIEEALAALDAGAARLAATETKSLIDAWKAAEQTQAAT